jgi:hypothetical protein
MSGSALLEASGTEIPEASKEWYSAIDAARRGLGQSEFEVKWAEGRSLDRDAAVQHARASID